MPATESTGDIRAYQDERLLIAASPFLEPTRLIVLNMDAPCEPRDVALVGDTLAPAYTALVKRPDGRTNFAEVGWSLSEKHGLLSAFDLSTGREVATAADDLRHARPAGLAGVGIDDNYVMDLLIDADGTLLLPRGERQGVRLINIGLPPLPPAARPGKGEARYGVGRNMGLATWFVGTAEFDLVLPRIAAGNSNGVRYFLFDKSRKEWLPVMVPGEYPTGLTQLKPFGRWLGGQPVGRQIAGLPQSLVDEVRAEQRERDDRYVKRLTKNPKPELYLYDTKTGKDYRISTDSIDTDLLLVDDDVVYYRVENRLYRAAIREGQTVTPELLAESDALANVSWAFKGPVCEGPKTAGEQ